MTRRERLEAKVERRREWADGRRDKANAVYAYTERYHGDTAFNTQPGHIPERARVFRMEDRAREDAAMAAHHETKADGLERHLDRSVFSDDADAIEQLEARIAERTAELERQKAINKEIRRGPDWEARLSPPLTEREKTELTSLAKCWAGVYKPGFPSYSLTNLGANIRRDRERIATLRARQVRTDQAEAATGGVLVEGDEWVRVTFAEKPARAILDALKSSGFRWGGGSWTGPREKLPEEVAPMRTKVAVIRDPSVPVGQVAPCWLNCPCGAKPAVSGRSDVACPCGLVYTASGWLK